MAFTARMEEDLDKVETVEADSTQILKAFYDTFSQKVESASEKMLSVKGVGFPAGLDCPVCGKPLHIKMGKNGHFLACSGYPDCSFTADYERMKRRISPVTPSRKSQLRNL